MIVFSDRHHDGLAYSLRLLVERLGGEIYFPIGEDWFTQGYFDVARPYNNNPDTIKQYLSIKPEHQPRDGTVPLNRIKEIKPTHYEVEDLAHGDTVKAITFDQFQQLDIDFIIASIPDHYATYTKLRDTHKPKAKVICHMGNMFNEVHDMMRQGVVKNLLASTIEFPVPQGVNTVFYHQEFNRDLFKYVPMGKPHKITSFVLLLPEKEKYYALKDLLPTYEMRAYGQGSDDGIIHNIADIAKIMQESGWGYHHKPLGDGYGHVIHNWFAVGRPVIGNVREYQSYMAGSLMKEDENCIALDSGEPLKKIADKIQEYSEPQKHSAMCESAYNTFCKVVDFDEEEASLRSFFDRAS